MAASELFLSPLTPLPKSLKVLSALLFFYHDSDVGCGDDGSSHSCVSLGLSRLRMYVPYMHLEVMNYRFF